MTRCGIRPAIAVAIASFTPIASGCAPTSCAPSPPTVVTPAPTPAARPVEDYEIFIREQGDRLVLELRSAAGPRLGEWTVGSQPTPADLAPVARAVPSTPSGARRVTVRAADGIVYAVLVSLLDACHENGISDVLVGPPASP